MGYLTTKEVRLIILLPDLPGHFMVLFFEEVEGAYWFRFVCVCVRASARQEPCMLRF